ncbi:hypothetical protein NMYAN_180050 [Nitrosomonas nitrosa]|uniref:Uncharacterized protein n=1 Tax=Nitrosomonas nitrosa TaxID=52442 RepID=A0A8H8YYE1_9PROT|nr:hypothetical protein [Nitrosomonas nitrosa]CAE6499997.1 hypothetical protein NMYAN_180050 [Nitrosomonas nitrosa]
MEFLAQRIADPVLLRVIRRFLKAGVMEEGLLHESESGTPQVRCRRATSAKLFA